MAFPGVICTIIAKNYLAHARVLCASFLKHHPGGRCYVLIVDDADGYVGSAENFTLIRLKDLQIGDAASLCFKYTVLELSTALKPFLIRFLIETHRVERLLYLDPDILVTADLDALFAALDATPVLLTPHLDRDYPDDGLLPNDGSILASGIFNLGFLGIRRSAETDDLLQWLEGKLRNHCFHDQANGYFVDQRFFDLAFFLFPGFGVEHGAGYNMAYWNLHTRQLEGPAGAWTVGRDPLRFFHFSNYRPDAGDTISGYTNRFTLANRPDLVSLFESYKQMLLEHGYCDATAWPYSYATFANGYRISPEVRREYARWLESGQGLSDPFGSEQLLNRARVLDAKSNISRRLARLQTAFWTRGGELRRRLSGGT